MRGLFAWLEEGSEANGGGDEIDGSPFGRLQDRNNRRAIAVANANRDMLAQAISEFRKWTAAAPDLASSIQEAGVVGCGLRIAPNGNALFGLRVALDKELTGRLMASGGTSELPWSMSENNGFVLNGSGRPPQAVLTAMAKAYVRRTAADLKTEEKTVLGEAALSRLQSESKARRKKCAR